MHALSQLGARLKREYQPFGAQYFYKGTDFAKFIIADVQRVEELLNNRPRKALNYHSTNEVFAKPTAPLKIHALDM